MKTILASTDFSDTGNNATDYAAGLAQEVNARLVLLNCFQIPVIASDGPAVTIPYEELELNSIKQLKEKQTELQKKFPKVQIDAVSRVGFADQEITHYTNIYHFDLIIMGISGLGKIAQLLGSTATYVARKTTTPLLIVPPESTFKAYSNVVVSFDFHGVENTDCINPALELVKQFNARVTALNIREPHHVMTHAESLASKQADTLLAEVPHRMVNYTDELPVEGIEHYLGSHQVDLLVMLKHKHSFFELLFNGSLTRKMAFHTHIPFLVLHG